MRWVTPLTSLPRSPRASAIQGEVCLRRCGDVVGKEISLGIKDQRVHGGRLHDLLERGMTIFDSLYTVLKQTT